MKVSRQMIIGYLELLLGVFALPQFVALIPPGSLPYVALVAGLSTCILRWLNQSLGLNWLSAAGLLTFAAGIFSVPELLALIPVTAMPVITGLAGILTLVARYLAGQNPEDHADPVNLLTRNGVK